MARKMPSPEERRARVKRNADILRSGDKDQRRAFRNLGDGVYKIIDTKAKPKPGKRPAARGKLADRQLQTDAVQKEMTGESVGEQRKKRGN
jgi:hypothetical protein